MNISKAAARKNSSSSVSSKWENTHTSWIIQIKKERKKKYLIFIRNRTGMWMAPLNPKLFFFYLNRKVATREVREATFRNVSPKKKKNSTGNSSRIFFKMTGICWTARRTGGVKWFEFRKMQIFFFSLFFDWHIQVKREKRNNRICLDLFFASLL
jgi:hypothetical protein